MTIARSQLIDLSVTRWYHWTSRCVRRAFLLAEGPTNRKKWIENRIKELAEIFAVGVGGFSVMDNHLHLLLRLDPDVAPEWGVARACTVEWTWILLPGICNLVL
jgi:REP element-mobilizing transposase RayT